jgi:HK97 family phage portal protein
MRRHARFQGYFQVRGTEAVPFRTFGDPDPAGQQSEILHLYQYDPQDDYYGMPDWYAALGAMGLDRTILEFNTYLFSNALMAHTAVIVEGGRLSDGAREAVKSFLQNRATGPNNAGRVLLLEDERDEVKVRFEKLGLDVEDVMIVEAQRHFRDVVVAAHGVPPRILGIITPGQLGATGEVEGQLRTFAETVLRPGQRELETALGVFLEEVAPGCHIRFAEMDATDLRADAEFYDRMIERGVFTAEEVRGMVEAGRG